MDVLLGHADATMSSDPSDAATAGDAGVGSIAALRVYRAEVPPETIALEIEAMSRVQAGSLPRLSDVTTLDDGRVCLVVERLGLCLTDLLSRGPLTPGEAVTICAPVVIAIDRLHAAGFALGRLAATDILLDDWGRPVVAGLGALRDLGDSSATAAERVEAITGDYRNLAEFIALVFTQAGSDAGNEVARWLRDRVAARPFLACAAELERRIFEVADAESIRTGVFPTSARKLPERVGAESHEITQISGADGDALSSELLPRRDRRGTASFLDALGIAPGETVDRLGQALDVPVFARLRTRLSVLWHVRRRALLMGGSVAGAVLVLALTLIPPGGGGQEAPAEASEAYQPIASDPEGGADPTATPNDGDAHAAAATDAPQEAAEATLDLLRERVRCLTKLSLACLEKVVQPDSALSVRDTAAIIGAQQGSELAVDSAVIARKARVVGDLGEAVIVELVAPDATSPPVSALIVRGESGWRLREVFGG